MTLRTSDALIIRAAVDADLDACAALDLSYETEYVWQVDLRDEYGAIALSFRTARLPRTLRVIQPRESNALRAALDHGDTVLVAEENQEVHGYLHLRIDHGHRVGWIPDIAVGRGWRRQRVGSRLFQRAYQLVQADHLQKIILETQTKNYPGICFCQKHGLIFCGYNDKHYGNNDIALFFGQNVRA